VLIDNFMERNARKFRGLDAPPAIARALRAAAELPYDEGARLERQEFLALRAGPQSAALRHNFAAERSARKVPGLEGVVARPIARVGVIGGGTMGTGIALAFLTAGYPVILIEREQAALARGVATIASTLNGNVSSGRMTQEVADSAQNRLDSSLEMTRLSDVDLVVEAAFETMEIKSAIFAQLDQVARQGAILATNTSYLDIDQIAAATRRPQDVVGLHFFSPANIMKLLEVVRGRETAPDVIATALHIATRIGKIPVVSGNAYGFIGNRMLAVRRAQAEAMVVEGASPEQVDRVLERFGFAMGPFRMADLAGLDLGWSAERSKGLTLRDCFCEAGRKGQKASAGFYDYDEARKPQSSAASDAIIAGFAQAQGITQRSFNDDEILDRLLWPMINEGARLLGEGIALRASDIDVVWINGYGWPAWTGGPMYHARKIGLDAVRSRLLALGLKPCEALAAALQQ
jgi:3-hydroxyacyl-CoA dehydrogenase